MGPNIGIFSLSTCCISAIVFSFFINPVAAQTNAVQAFEEQLSGNAPIKSLWYTEIDCATGRQRQFFAAIDTNGFFLREYILAENPTEPITLTNIPQSPNFHGRNGDISWQINGTQISEANKSDPIPNIYNLGSDSAEEALAAVLNFGVPSVQRGTFVWKNATSFNAQLVTNMVLTNIKTGKKLTKVDGYIGTNNGYISELHVFGGTAHYEYATNSALPFGVPSKILIGKNNSECGKIYLINKLAYGHAEESEHVFSPEAKFVSTNIITLVFVTNGNRHIVYGARQQLPPPQLKF
jgi:hypothetical protein